MGPSTCQPHPGMLRRYIRTQLLHLSSPWVGLYVNTLDLYKCRAVCHLPGHCVCLSSFPGQEGHSDPFTELGGPGEAFCQFQLPSCRDLLGPLSLGWLGKVLSVFWWAARQREVGQYWGKNGTVLGSWAGTVPKHPRICCVTKVGSGPQVWGLYPINGSRTAWSSLSTRGFADLKHS